MRKIQAIEIVIPNGQSEITISEDLATGYDKFTGVAIVNTEAKELNIKKMMFDGKELLPKNCETELILTSTNVNPDERFFSFDEKNTNSNIELTFVAPDTNGRKFNVYLRLEK